MTVQVSVLDLPPKNLQHRSAQLRDTFWKEARFLLWSIASYCCLTFPPHRSNDPRATGETQSSKAGLGGGAAWPVTSLNRGSGMMHRRQWPDVFECVLICPFHEHRCLLPAWCVLICSPRFVRYVLLIHMLLDPHWIPPSSLNSFRNLFIVKFPMIAL